MAQQSTSESILLIVALLALVGIVFVAASVGTQRSMWGMMGGGGMMDGGQIPDSGPGIAEWIVLGASVAFFGASAAILFRARTARPTDGLSPSVAAVPRLVESSSPSSPAPTTAADAPIPELSLVKLLDEDERRMYLDVRDRGGEALQRDLVASGVFSKAKVTRVLDRLEAKGLVVRERHGMTNRVRIVAKVGR